MQLYNSKNELVDKEKAFPVDAVPTVLNGDEPSGEWFSTTFRETSSGVLGEYVANKIMEPDNQSEQGFDIEPWVEGFEEYRDVLSRSNNEKHAEFMRSKITRELVHKQKYEGLPWYQQLAGGVLDPINLLPIAGTASLSFKGLSLGGRALRAGKGMAVLTAAETTLEEGLKQTTRETQSLTESAINVGVATVFGGTLGAASPVVVNAFKNTAPYVGKKANEILGDLGTKFFKESENMVNTLSKLPESTAGAQQVVGLGEATKVTDLPTIFRNYSPNTRAAFSEVPEHRELALELADSSLKRVGESEGIAMPRSVESAIRTNVNIPAAKTLIGLQDIHKASRDAAKKAGTTAMTREDFNRSVYIAMMNNDQSSDPFVQKAAEQVRKNFFDPIKDEAINIGILPKDISPQNADSYITQLWWQDKIRAYKYKGPNGEAGFVPVLAEKIKIQALNNIDEKIKLAQEQVSKLEPSVKKTRGIKETVLKGTKEEKEKLITALDEKMKAFDLKTRQTKQKLSKLDQTNAKHNKEIGELESKLKGATPEQKASLQKRIQQKKSFIAKNDKTIQRHKNSIDSAKVKRTELKRELDVNRAIIQDKDGFEKAREKFLDTTTQQEKRFESNLEYLQELRIRKDMTDDEWGEVANEAANHILSGGYGGKNINIMPLTRGPLKDRKINVPQNEMIDWLNADVETAVKHYARTMGVDVELHKKFGSTTLKPQIEKLEAGYDAKIEAAPDARTASRLSKQKTEAVADMNALIEFHRGMYGLPDDPNSFLHRSSEFIKKLIYTSKLGSVLIASFNDVPKVVMRQGLWNTFQHGLVPMARGLKNIKMARTEADETAAYLEVSMSSMAKGVFNVKDDFVKRTALDDASGLQKVGIGAEKVADFASQQMGKVTMLDQWNYHNKAFVGAVAQGVFNKTIMNMDKADPKFIGRLARAGIGRQEAESIRKMLNKHMVKYKGATFANMAEWEDKAARDLYQEAISQEMNTAIVTPSAGSAPLLFSKSQWSLLTMIKSFAAHSVEKTLMTAIQDKDLAVVNGMGMMIATGGLVSWLRTPEERRSDDPKVLLADAVDKSGVLGLISDVDTIMESLTGGRVSTSRLTGERSPWAKSLPQVIMGPVGDYLTTGGRVVGDLSSGDINQKTVHDFRKMLPFQNTFYLKDLFDFAETGVADLFDLPEKRKKFEGLFDSEKGSL